MGASVLAGEGVGAGVRVGDGEGVLAGVGSAGGVTLGVLIGVATGVAAGSGVPVNTLTGVLASGGSGKSRHACTSAATVRQASRTRVRRGLLSTSTIALGPYLPNTARSASPKASTSASPIGADTAPNSTGLTHTPSFSSPMNTLCENDLSLRSVSSYDLTGPLLK